MRTLSGWTCLLIGIVLLLVRLGYSEVGSGQKLKLTTWDAFGYYMYLPGFIIYEDMNRLEWVSGIDQSYDVTGGSLYQANKAANGNYVTKYLGGVAILQTPFFMIAHWAALGSGYPADGFSLPYQWALGLGALFYAFLALFCLRSILLRYFSDKIVAWTLVLLFLASNLVQYVAIDGAMSHAYILPLYTWILLITIKWHENPKLIYAILGGLIIGLAAICRPTEGLMVLIPILWDIQNRNTRKKKMTLLREYKSHILIALLFGFIGVFPQLLYWKLTAGTWVYNVGSKWVFLNPWFRVLFGFTNGWFIYTPVTILFVAGLFFTREYSFRWVVWVFCLLNIWVVISWFDWRYGSTYSTRALSQSYPVFAFGLAAVLQYILKSKWRYLMLVMSLFLVGANFIQIMQYNSRILIPNEMTGYYYSGVYLDMNPTALDMARLDTKEELKGASNHDAEVVYELKENVLLEANPGKAAALAKANFSSEGDEAWMLIKTNIRLSSGYYGGYINAEIYGKDTVKYARVRLNNPLTVKGKFNNYEFHVKIPAGFEASNINLYIASEEEVSGEVGSLVLSLVKLRN